MNRFVLMTCRIKSIGWATLVVDQIDKIKESTNGINARTETKSCG